MSIQNPKDFMVMSEDEAPPPPPLNVMSLSIKTCMHPTKRTNEIVAMSILFYHDGKCRYGGRKNYAN